MRRLVGVAASGLVALSLFGAPASAGKAKTQTVEGTIALPAVFAQSATGGTPFDGCWAGLQRRVSTASQNTEQANGVVGYRFEVDPATWNKPFKLEATGGEGTVDLDLYIYLHEPPLDEWPNDPQNAGTPLSVDFTTREEGGEKGIVPKDTTAAIVCLYGSPDSYGYDASFTYTAGKGVK